MVAIVSGNSLGLGQTSLAALGARGLIGTPGHGRNGDAAYVNVATGNLVLQGRDDYLAVLGADIETVRTYNSQGREEGGQGDNWGISLARRPLVLTGAVAEAGSRIVHTAADGAIATYVFDEAAGNYVSRTGTGAYDTISYRASDDRLIWTDGATGVSERYEAGGQRRLLALLDATGRGFSYRYDDAGLLGEAVSSNGETTSFDYVDGLLARVGTTTKSATGEDVAQTRVRYTYDASRRLTAVEVDLSPADNKVSDANVYRTTYTYKGDTSLVASIAQTGGTRLEFGYEEGGQSRITSVTDALGRTTSFMYAAATATRRASTAVEDPLGRVTRYEVDTAGQLTQVTPPAGAGGVQRYTWAGGDVTSVEDGAGGITVFRYEGGNRVYERDAVGNTIERTFNEANQVLTETVHAVADPDGDGAKLPSSPLTTRNVYDAANPLRLRFSISATGAVTEHRYDSYGRLVRSLSYGAAARPSGSLDEASLEQWAAGHGSAGVRQVAMAYDARGQLATRTVHGAFDAGGVLDPDTVERETFVYSHAGLLLKRVSAGGGITSSTYDGLGRVLTFTDAADRTTTTVYRDASLRTEVTMANGLVSASVYDKAGLLVSQTNLAGTAGTTQFTYDAGGRLRMTRDAAGVETWMLYDPAGRKVADVDANGSVTEFTYDAAGLLVRQVAYATAVRASLLIDAAGAARLDATLADVRPPGTDADVRTWRAYDAAQRLVRVATTVGDGTKVAVTEMRYDGASRLVQTTARASLLDADLVSLDGIPLPPAHSLDRVTCHFHDADGRSAGTLDAEGFLTVTLYNAAGLARQQIAYATEVSASLRATGSLQAMRAEMEGRADEAKQDDINTFTVYDAKGRAVGRVDGEGYLTETVFDADSNAVQTIRYAAKARGPVSGTSTISAVRPAETAGKDALTTRTFDAMGRVASETGPDGVRTAHAYDRMGNLISTIRGAGSSERRTLRTSYDMHGRVTGALSAEGAMLLTDDLDAEEIAAIWSRYGVKHTYDTAGRRTRTIDPLGHATLFFYNVDGALRYSVNHLGEVKENRYDVQGRLVDELTYAGRVRTAGLVGGTTTDDVVAMFQAVADPATDSRTRTTYTASGQVATRTDAGGAVTAFTYNAFGDQVRMAAAGRATETSTVDGRGLRTALSLAMPGVDPTSTTVYDAFGRAVGTRDANGREQSREYDRLGRQVVTTDPLARRRLASYDAFDRVLTQTDALGHVTRYAYDRATRTTTVTTPEGIETSTTLTVHGQVHKLTDGKGNVTSHSYDRNGNLLRAATALTTTSNVYDTAGRLVLAVDANGVKVQYAYDAANRVLTRTVDGKEGGAGDADRLNLVTSYRYDGKGQQISVTDPGGRVTVTTYDLGGSVLTQVVDPEGLKLKTAYTHDDAGRVLTVTAPGGTVTQYVYDALGRRTQERVDPDGLNLGRSWTYDATGNVLTSTDAAGKVTRYAYDNAGRLVYTVGPVGNVSLVGYDAEGRATVTRSYAIAINFADLAEGFSVAQIKALVQVDAAHDRVEYRVLDDDGRVLALVDGTGAVTRYGHDANGNVIWRRAYANAVDLAAWVRGTIPAVAADAVRDRRDTTTYDALDRPVYAVDGSGAVTRRDYDDNGNVVRLTAYATRLTWAQMGTFPTALVESAVTPDDPSDRVTRYAYDAAGRRVLAIDAVGAVTQTAYDAAGNAVTVTAYANRVGLSRLWANPTAATADAWIAVDGNDRTTRHAYDAAGRRTHVLDAEGGLTSFTHDAEGRVLVTTRHARPLPVGSRLTAGTIAAIAPAAGDRRESFGYDAAGNLVTTTDALGKQETATFDAMGRKLTFTNKKGATWTYAYDAAGRMVRETTPQVELTAVSRAGSAEALSVETTVTAPVVTRLVYDALGNLQQRIEAFGRPEQRTTSYDYDAAGRQVRVDFPDMLVYDPAADDLAASSAVALSHRKEVLDSGVHTRTFYDALGNAVAGRDVGGRISQKVYDRLGQMVFEIDALGHVTRYERNAFGEVVKLVRHAEPVVVPSAVAGADDATTLAQVEAALATTDEGADRTLLRTYDRAGRLTLTTEPSAYVYEHDLSASGVGRNASKTTRQVYNAFGELVQVVTAQGSGAATAATTHYRDRAGRETATVDALGYLTLRTFDTAGNVLSSTEYANALAEGWSTAGYGDGPATSADDRETTFTYDAMNRKLTETRIDALYSRQADGTAVRGDLTTSYAYDAVGNQAKVTDAAGATTYTYHDALGRIEAVVSPVRKDEDGANVRPLTEFRRDAHGQVVLTTERAKGGNAVTLSGFSTGADAADRKTFTLHDDLGRVVQSTDAAGHSRFFSHDRHGNVAKQWELVEEDGARRAVFQVNTYDKLGRLVQSVTPDSRWVSQGGAIAPVTQAEAGVVKATMAYNAFGEMTSRKEPGRDEFFQYDGAGRLWRTNSGDGIVRINLFDLQGNVTSEIRSSGSGRIDDDLMDVDDAAEADKLRYARRTDIVRDALGRVVARQEGARREVQGGVRVERQLVQTSILGSGTVAAGGGMFGPYTLTGVNKVALYWPNVAHLGSGDVKVTVDYMTRETAYAGDTTGSSAPGGILPSVARKFTSEALTSHAAASGVTLSWADTPGGGSCGIAEITRVVVYKKDVEGVWRPVVDQAPGYGGNVFDIAAPPNPDTAITLEMRKVGSTGDTGWFAIATRDFGSYRRFDADGLGPGKYEYRVEVKTSGESWHDTSAGVITLTAPPLNPISASLGHGKIAAGVISWRPPAEGVGQDFRYRLAGSTGTWRSLAVQMHASGVQMVDTRGLDDGVYDFELLWSRLDHGVPTSHAIGTFRVGSTYGGTIDSTPVTASISTSEGGAIAQDPTDSNGESRYLRPVVLQNVDRWGNVVSITDPRSAAWKTTYAYNGNNQVVMQATPALSAGLGAPVTRTYYDAMGRQVAVRDARNNVNGQTYDLAGNLTAESHADDGVVLHRYNVFGEKVWTKDAIGGVQTFTYDPMGRMTAMVTGAAVDYSVGSNNETLTGVSRAISDRWTYDELGRRTSHTNGNGEKTAYAYDLRGNLVQVRQPLGQSLRMAYDAQGRKVAEVDANGSAKTWTYNALGRLLSHVDLGGVKTTYGYDNAGQLVTQTNARGQSLAYSYDAVGQLTRLADSERNQVTTYGWDLGGRRVREKVVQNGVTYQDNFLSYDTQGRLRDVADGRVHIEIAYDAAGNRTRIGTRVNYQGVRNEVTDSSVRYFAYDEMNRQTVVDAVDPEGTISADQGHQITYDKNGNRETDVAYRKYVKKVETVANTYDMNGEVVSSKTVVSYQKAFGKVAEAYDYDALDRLSEVKVGGVTIDKRNYDGAGRVVRSGPVDVSPAYLAVLNEGVDPANAHSPDVRINRYDANGRLLNQRVKSSDAKTLKLDISWDKDKQLAGFGDYVADGYDAAGNVLGHVVFNYDEESATEYRTTLARFEGYHALATSGKSTQNLPGKVTHEYDVNGFLVGIKDASQPGNNRTFVNDAEGRVLFTNQQDNIQRQLIVNGEVMGTYGVGVNPLDPSRNSDHDPNFSDHANFNFGYAPVSVSHPSASPGAYTVRSGDTLQGIAQSAYGESALWYRIADANGLASSNDLRVGQTISIPNRVGTVGNGSTTFRPYDPSQMVGDTTPSMAAPSADAGCGGVGQLLMVIVAVAVTAWLGPVATTLLGGEVLGMAAAAAVGSVASQAVGLATGAIDKFSWKSVALAAVSAGVTKGVGVESANAFVNGAIRSVVTQGIGLATGLQQKFSWRAVAASAVGSAVGQEIGEALQGADFGFGKFGNDLAARSITAFAAGTAAAALRGGRVSVAQVAVDAFGNALGSSLAEANWGSGQQIQGASAAGSGRNASWYSDMGQRQAIEEATGQPIVTDMDENFGALGPIGSNDVLADANLRALRGRTSPFTKDRKTYFVEDGVDPAVVRQMELKRNLDEMRSIAAQESALGGGRGAGEMSSSVLYQQGLGDIRHTSSVIPPAASAGPDYSDPGNYAQPVPASTPASPWADIDTNMATNKESLKDFIADKKLGSLTYVAAELFVPGSLFQAGLTFAGPAIGKAVGAGVAQLNRLPVLGSTLSSLGSRVSGVTTSYLGSTGRVAKYEEHLQRLQANGYANMEKLAEFAGRTEMLKKGYILAGEGKLIGNVATPGLGRGTHGIDRVYKRLGDPDDLVVLESKFRTNFNGADPLGLLGSTRHGPQMSSSWMSRKIDQMRFGPHGERINQLGRDLYLNGYQGRYMNVLNGNGKSYLYDLDILGLK